MYLEDRISKLESSLEDLSAKIKKLLLGTSSFREEKTETPSLSPSAFTTPDIVNSVQRRKSGLTMEAYSSKRLSVGYLGYFDNYLDYAIHNYSDIQSEIEKHLVRMKPSQGNHWIWNGPFFDGPTKKPVLNHNRIRFSRKNLNRGSNKVPIDLRLILWTYTFKDNYKSTQEKVIRICSKEGCINPEHQVCIPFSLQPLVHNLRDTEMVFSVFGDVTKYPRKIARITEEEHSKLVELNRSPARSRGKWGHMSNS